MAVADLGNGHPDIVTANYVHDTVSVLLGNGDGTFQPVSSFAVGSRARRGGGGGLNGDGHPDIVTANYGDNTVSVLLGNGDGTFQRAQRPLPWGVTRMRWRWRTLTAMATPTSSPPTMATTR